ncbi:acyltransferase family protein [Sphingomonas ginkgonis]|uniref:acyltransferase family protein n=1 Tax=Sphingomonas ginkgonis TaxID=2315330 RepID=UPI00163A3895|nr:acyltransferase [Sphingomonas ginkgonis]
MLHADARASLRVDTLRGIACVLLILFHAVAEVRLAKPMALDGLARANEFAIFLRMPLFIFLSGYVYAARPVEGRQALRFLQRKARRLLVPLAFVTLLTLGLRATFGHGSFGNLAPDFVAAIAQPSYQLWFVEALFLIFLALACGMQRLLHSVAGCLLLIAAVAVGEVFGTSTIRLFSVGQAIHFLPYFVTGVLAFGLIDANGTPPRTRLLAGAALLLIGLLRSAQLRGLEIDSAATSIGALLSLLIMAPVSSWLTWIGRRSMVIYLYHALVLAAFTRVLPGPPAAVLAQVMVLAVLLPIMVEMAAERWLPVVLPLLGGRAHRPLPSARQGLRFTLRPPSRAAESI